MRAAGLRRGHGRASDPPEPARAGARGAGSRGHWTARPRPRRRSRGPGPELPCAEPEVGYGGAPGLPAGWSCGRLGHSVGRPHGGCSPEKPPLGAPLRAPPGRAGTGLGCKCARESVGGRGGAVQPAAAPPGAVRAPGCFISPRGRSVPVGVITGGMRAVREGSRVGRLRCRDLGLGSRADSSSVSASASPSPSSSASEFPAPPPTLARCKLLVSCSVNATQLA